MYDYVRNKIQYLQCTFIMQWKKHLTQLIFDFLVPMWGTKKYGGSKYGIWGCAIGFLFAFWMGPLGVILGPLIGAFIGELIYQQNSQKALRAAKGAFIGFLFGSLLKFVSCLVMGYYLIRSF